MSRSADRFLASRAVRSPSVSTSGATPEPGLGGGGGVAPTTRRSGGSSARAKGR